MTAPGHEVSTNSEQHPKEAARTTEALSSTEVNDRPNSNQRRSSHTWKRIGVYFFSFSLGVLLSFAFTLFLTERNGTNLLIVEFSGFPNNLTRDIWRIIAILIFGAFGGLLYSLRERQMELPYISQNALPATANKSSKNQSVDSINESYKGKIVNLGIVADCLAGIGGALGIFLILPVSDIKDVLLLKLLATAMIGGYGGRSLLDRALGNILQKQEELEKSQKETEKQLNIQKEQSQKDARTVRLLSRYLDSSLKLPDEEVKELLDNIGTASPKVRFETIFKDAQSALDYHSYRKSDPVSIAIIGNTLKVFESLQNSDQDKSNDRYPAHVAYAHMALEKWEKAIKSLEEAQGILKGNAREDNDQNWLVYESNRIICKLNLDNENKHVADNLELLNKLNGKLKTLDGLFTKGNEKDPPLWVKVNKLLSRPEGFKSVIKTWIENHQENDEVEKWLEETGWLGKVKNDLDGGSDGLEKQSSPGEVNQAMSNPNPVADTSQ